MKKQFVILLVTVWAVLSVVRFTAVSAAPAAIDERALELIATGCANDAKVRAENAVKDAIAVIGANGGNVSASFVSTLEDSKAGYVLLQTATCEAEAIRKFKVKTPYPID